MEAQSGLEGGGEGELNEGAAFGLVGRGRGEGGLFGSEKADGGGFAWVVGIVERASVEKRRRVSNAEVARN